MHKMRVGVLRGGPSAEYDVSLKTGQAVLQMLPSEKYEIKDIFIDKDGTWHLRGLSVPPTRVLDQIDVVFNALHGAYGEDGTLQRFLDTHGVRYTGSGALASATAMHKVLAKDHLKNAPCTCARHTVLGDRNVFEDDVREVFRTFQLPIVVKPLSGGSSLYTTLARSYAELKHAIATVLLNNTHVLIEEYVRGREATVVIVEDFRGEAVYAFPPIEISYNTGAFFDYDEKYSGRAREVCPAPFEKSDKNTLLNAARYVHTTLGLKHYSRSDFIVARDGVYFLEVNTLPGLTPESLLPKAVEAVGATLPQFFDHVVQRAYTQK